MARIGEIEEELEGLVRFLGLDAVRRKEGLNTEIDIGIAGRVLCCRIIGGRGLRIPLDNIFQVRLQTTLSPLNIWYSAW